MPFAPQVFGKYYLVDKIATGGMAEIFKAKTFGAGGFENLLVIKRILAHLSDNESFVDMFIDEAKVSVAIQHPNIIRIYDFGKIGDNYFMAMECVDGKDVRNILRKLAKKRKFLPVEYAIYATIETCKGLHYAHKKSDLKGRPYGIVHRDVSPSNVLVSYEGAVKIADFGIAKAESNSYNTQSGVLKGKFEYMSPEQAAGLEIDHRSDIFSLGIVFHEMLTGRRLFKSKSEVATLSRIKSATVTPPSQINARVPEALDQIVMKALTQDTKDRYQSAQALCDDLQDYLFPTTVDQVREDLSRFMQDLFKEEIMDERRRLEMGSEIAAKLHEDAPQYVESWEGHTNSSMTSTSFTAVQNWLPLAMSALALISIPIAIVVVGGVLYVTVLQPDTEAPPPVEVPAETPVVTTAAIQFLVTPGSTISLKKKTGAGYGDPVVLNDGTPTTEFLASELEPTEYEITIEAEGYEVVTKQVVLSAGKTVNIVESLKEKKVAVRPPSAGTTRPPGTSTSSAPASSSGSTEPSTAPSGAAPGTLKVSIQGGVGWARVYVDGKEQAEKAPNSYSLPPGSHKIEVKNDELGISYVGTVTITSGGSESVRVTPEI